MRIWKFILLCCLVFGSGSSAFAQSESLWTYRAAVGTDFPVMIGGKIEIEGPRRLLLSTALGTLPESYLDTINAASEGLGWYSPEVSTLISAALENSLVWRTSVGWRPWQKRGFHFSGGYTLVTLGGGLSGAELVAVLTGQELASGGSSERNLSVASTSHMLNLELGWSWSLWRGLFLRTSLGGAFTVAASSVITPQWTPRPRFESSVTELARAGEDYLNETLVSYVHTGFLGLSLGWEL